MLPCRRRAFGLGIGPSTDPVCWTERGTALKPSVKLSRYLAALALLALGMALAGCSGILGSVDGEGGAGNTVNVSFGTLTVPVPAGATITRSTNAVSGTTETITVSGLPGGATVQFTLLSQNPAGMAILTSGASSASIQFTQPGTAVVRVRVSVPGEAVRTVDVTFNVVHPQGHGQGGGAG